MDGEPLMTPTRAFGAVGTVTAFSSILAETFCLAGVGFIPSVVEDTGWLCVGRVHLMKHLVPPFEMAATADVKVLTKELLASITVHVYVGQFLKTKFTKEAIDTITATRERRLTTAD